MDAVARPKPKTPRRSRTYRLPETLIQALEELAEGTRRPVTTELEIAIEKHLRDHGKWPPPEPPAPDAATKPAGKKKP